MKKEFIYKITRKENDEYYHNPYIQILIDEKRPLQIGELKVLRFEKYDGELKTEKQIKFSLVWLKRYKQVIEFSDGSYGLFHWRNFDRVENVDTYYLYNAMAQTKVGSYSMKTEIAALKRYIDYLEKKLPPKTKEEQEISLAISKLYTDENN